MLSVAIFGGGISGLTCAHILVKQGFHVTIYESENILGGMARSQREQGTNIPTEHSWRGYAPFYRNFFHIAKQIPTGPNNTVFDNLSEPVTFQMLNNYTKNQKRNNNISLSILYLFSKAILSDERDKDAKFHTALAPILEKKLSKDDYAEYGYDFFLNFMMGPGWGMDKDTASLGHYAKFMEYSLFQADGKTKWQVMRMPTNEAWFDHWETSLRAQGVEFYFNTYLIRINANQSGVQNCIIQENNQENNNNFYSITADEYIFAINPFNLEEILKSSVSVPDSIKQQHILSNKQSYYEMISFTISFTKKIDFPRQSAYILVDGPLNITFYPQDAVWNPEVNLGEGVKTAKRTPEGVKSLWSGTCIMTHRDIDTSQGKKIAINLTIDELQEEILHEILDSPILREKLSHITCKDMTIKIWYEWSNKNGTLVPIYKKFSNNIYNQDYRLSQTTIIPNMYIGGAHTKTSIDIWSMEGAVESGILVSNNILEKYGLPLEPIYVHKSTPGIISAMKSVDNHLYRMGLPHVVDVIIILIFLIIFLIILKIIIKIIHNIKSKK